MRLCNPNPNSAQNSAWISFSSSLNFSESFAFAASKSSALQPMPTCVEINFWAPHAIDAMMSPYSCICSMAWSFQAIDATLLPRQRRFDGVEVHEGPRSISQDSLTHWLISTQILTSARFSSSKGASSFFPALKSSIFFSFGSDAVWPRT